MQSTKSIIIRMIQITLFWAMSSMLILAPQVEAKELPRGKPFEYIANKEPLKDLLNNFASAQGIPVIVSPKIDQVVNGQFKSSDARSFLNDISEVFGLIWYYDGSLIHLYKSNEIQSKMINVGEISPDKLRRNIQSMGVYDSRFTWRYVPGQKVLFVSGPPRFVEMVGEVAGFLATEHDREMKETTNVRIFRLKYALAYDRSYTSRGKVVKVKGLATVLKEILGGQSGVGPVESDDDQGSHPYKSAKKSDEKSSEASEKQGKKESSSELDARITADRRLNAIVINDRPEKMPMYQSLIKTLDVASEQVEISVSIMDISSDKLSELGFDWRNSGSDGSIQFGSNGTDAKPYGSSSGAYGVQTIVAAKAGQFIAKVKMLSESGEAQIFSRPVVLTKDMVEAVVDNSSTFYVRIAGKEQVELFPVTYGTLMRVTPRIVDEDDARWIHMDINIEDGHKNGEQSVDQIPAVKQTSINTQSMIPNGDSLLIGGYIYTSTKEVSSGIPILEDIPLLGYFFSWNSDESRQWVRLFMISPRTVTRSDMLKNVNHPTLKGQYRKKFAHKYSEPPRRTAVAKSNGKRTLTKKQRYELAKKRQAMKANQRAASRAKPAPASRPVATRQRKLTRYEKQQLLLRKQRQQQKSNTTH